MRFKPGEDVIIKVGKIIGLVTDIKYEVSFPDKDGLPLKYTFTDLELESIENKKPLGYTT